MTTRFGIFVPQGWRMDLTRIADPVEQWEAMTAVAKAADAGSWDSIWVFDHFHTVPEPTKNTVFEAWIATAALARDTKRVNIGQMVCCNGYRNPAHFAKLASSADAASNGRIYVGFGAGWYEHEWRAYGYPWPETKERMAAFREAVQIVHGMWTQDDFVFEGKFYSVDKPINEPKGVRKPHPSFWIGGGGPKVTLKLVAQYANACNVGGGDPEVIREKLGILKQHCETVGRNYDEIIKSTDMFVYPIDKGADPQAASEQARHLVDWESFQKTYTIASDDELANKIEAAIDAGADYVNFYVPGVAYDVGLVTRMEAIAKRFG